MNIDTTTDWIPLKINAFISKDVADCSKSCTYRFKHLAITDKSCHRLFKNKYKSICLEDKIKSSESGSSPPKTTLVLDMSSPINTITMFSHFAQIPHQSNFCLVWTAHQKFIISNVILLKHENKAFVHQSKLGLYRLNNSMQCLSWWLFHEGKWFILNSRFANVTTSTISSNNKH